MKKLFLKSLAVMAIFSLSLISCDDNIDVTVPCDNGNLVFNVNYDTLAGLSVSDVTAGNSTVPLSDFEVSIDGQIYSSNQLQGFSPNPGAAYDVCATYIPQPNCSECFVFVADSSALGNPGGGAGGGSGGGSGGGGTGGGSGGSGSVISSDCGTILMTAALDSNALSNFQAILQTTFATSFDWSINGTSQGSGTTMPGGSSIDLMVSVGDVICVLTTCPAGNSETCFTIQ